MEAEPPSPLVSLSSWRTRYASILTRRWRADRPALMLNARNALADVGSSAHRGGAMEPAGPARVERRLAAILAADVAGYSRLIEADEEGTLGRLKVLRAEVIDPKIAEHRGRIVKTTGDGLLVEFASVVDALRCAVETQAALAESNAPTSSDRRIEFRIGINVGDIVVEHGAAFGDGGNAPARFEDLAEPGGICVSARVQEDASGRLNLAFEDMGDQALKNIARPVRVYRVRPKSPHPTP